MKKGITAGIGLIIIGFITLGIHFYYYQSGREAEVLLTEGKLIFERGDRDSINKSINVLTHLVARYPGTEAEAQGYYYIGQGYEKLGCNRLAYLKYIYILKNRKHVSKQTAREVKARIAGLQIKAFQTEEGVHKLLDLLRYSESRDFKSRIYTELGHTYLKSADLPRARRMFDIALTEDGRNEEAILGKASTLKRMGNTMAAFDLYEYFLRYFGNFSSYAPDVKKSFMRQLYSTAYDSYVRGRYSDAVSLFNRIVKIFPESGISENSIYMIGECYYRMGRYADAITYFNKTLGNSFHHKDEDALVKKGLTYYQSGRYDLAAREFQNYISEYPHGRHVKTAQRWKSLSADELLGQIRNRVQDEIEDEYIRDLSEQPRDHTDKYRKKRPDKKRDVKPLPQEVEDKTVPEKKERADKGVMERADDDLEDDVEYENVAEL